MQSARCPPPKVPSPTLSAASKGEQKLMPTVEETPAPKENADEFKGVTTVPVQTLEKPKIAAKAPDMSEATHESMSMKEPASQGSTPLVEEEVQQKMVAGEAGGNRSSIILLGICLWSIGHVLPYRFLDNPCYVIRLCFIYELIAHLVFYHRILC